MRDVLRVCPQGLVQVEVASLVGIEDVLRVALRKVVRLNVIAHLPHLVRAVILPVHLVNFALNVGLVFYSHLLRLSRRRLDHDQSTMASGSRTNSRFSLLLLLEFLQLLFLE